jgi:transcription-repair coupling factor (superfamily II helicase)
MEKKGQLLIPETFVQSQNFLKLKHAIRQSEPHIALSGLVGSSQSFAIAQSFLKIRQPFVWILNTKEEAAYRLNDLERLLGDADVMFYPGSYRRPYEIEETDNANVLLRAEVLNRLNSQKKPAIIVTYPDALFEKVVTRKELEKNTLKLAVGDLVSIDFINETLFEYHFRREDFVTEPGEFSVRGGILDVFSFSNDQPYRIEFFGNEVASIRLFDVETQLSESTLKNIRILPNVENKFSDESRQNFIDFLPKKTVAFFQNKSLIKDRIQWLFEKASERFEELSGEIQHNSPDALFCNQATVEKSLNSLQTVSLNSETTDKTICWNTSPQPAFNRQFELLIKHLSEQHKLGYSTTIYCATQQQAQRFHDIFEEHQEAIQYSTVIAPLHEGFIDHNQKIGCYTDHQIFGRYHKFELKNGYAKKQAISLKQLNHLEMGDFVTHIDHGIGRFGGLQKIQVEGNAQEAIKLVYGERDILYVSIHSLHKISKYNGKDGVAPKIYKLGSGAWKKLKQKTKKRVKEIAFNLIEVYAKQRLKKGFQYAPDSSLQLELEASFIYEDTPDQESATKDVKADMESERPMDRLVCGDVGFGKTEVAIRAAFKAIDNGKQVAVLVPTTILAFQHFKTFSARLKEFPVTVDYLNRFRSNKEKRQVLDEISTGKIDLLIGTHQLVNKNVAFKDLGLLIVDEEQKFGVAVKEKLRALKENVDVLTLTATPIPRTLQFSLMAARDLSIINTPPPNRYPIESQVIGFNEESIRDAVSYEIQRGGQVFFIHNRIENIKEVAGMIQRLVPDAKIAVGHGQMEGKKLEATMLDFMNGLYDVLVSTTIVESGLDVPNANTIFINNAHHFGLSDLHQMRGRVGRSNKKAFCYFVTAPLSTLTEEARKRITALEQHTALGSGFQIAMKDLEIRGAGDLLGGEQSGFINDIGFETYQKILKEAIDELKETDYKGLYQDSKEKEPYVSEIQLDTDIEILIPDDYVNNVEERLVLYKRLSEINDEPSLMLFEKELNDRFGTPNNRVIGMLNSVRLKWVGKSLGMEKIMLKQQKLIGYFIGNQESTFYQTPVFQKLLVWVQKNSRHCKLKERETRNGLRLMLVFDGIASVEKALEQFQSIYKETR